MSKQACLYARFSPRPGAETCQSNEVQLERLTAWCRARDWPIAGTYSDVDASGASTEGRDGLADAIDHCCRIKGVLVVYDLSRLSRETSDALAIAKQLRKRGAGLTSMIEMIDTTTSVGRFVFTIFAAKATLDRELSAERTSKAMKHHQADGRRMGRADRVPYGWTADPADAKRLVEAVDEQRIVRYVLNQRHEPDIQAIAECLDGGGWEHQRSGRPWNTRSGRALIRSILARREYGDYPVAQEAERSGIIEEATG
jgi:site-specific DNA recombinase